MKQNINEDNVKIYITIDPAVVRKTYVEDKLEGAVMETDINVYKNVFKMGGAMDWVLHIKTDKEVTMFVKFTEHLLSGAKKTYEMPQVLETLKTFVEIEELEGSRYAYLKSQKTKLLTYHVEPNENQLVGEIKTIDIGTIDYTEAKLRLMSLVHLYTGYGAKGVMGLMWCISLNAQKGLNRNKIVNLTIDATALSFDLGVIGNLAVKTSKGKISLRKFYVEFLKNEAHTVNTSALDSYYKGKKGLWRLGWLSQQDEKIKIDTLKAMIEMKKDRMNEFASWKVRRAIEDARIDPKYYKSEGWEEILKAPKPVTKRKKVIKELSQVKSILYNTLVKQFTDEERQKSFFENFAPKIMDGMMKEMSDELTGGQTAGSSKKKKKGKKEGEVVLTDF